MPRSLSRDRLVSLLQTAATRRVTVVGDAMLDVYLRGDVERISPEAPVPVVRVRERRNALGGAGNVSAHVVSRRLGHASSRTTLELYAHAIPADDRSVPAEAEPERDATLPSEPNGVT